jgi:hypothetical protein
LHCDLSISNVLLNRSDDESEPVGLLIDYDYSINTEVNAADADAVDDTPIGKRVVAVSDAGVSSDAFEGRLTVEQRQALRTVRFPQLLEMSTNCDLRAGYTALYGHRGSS